MICSVENYSNTIHCRGMCNKHYKRLNYQINKGHYLSIQKRRRMGKTAKDLLSPEAFARRKEKDRLTKYSIKGQYYSLVCAAKRYGEFNITIEHYKTLRVRPCHYCGGSLPPTGSGLDRVDSNKSYLINNVVPCCSECNRIKSDKYTEAQMIEIAKFLIALEKAGVGK